MNELYDLIPDAALPFDSKDIDSQFQKYNGKYGCWKEYMNDRNVSARHRVEEVILDGWKSVGSPAEDGHWRLLFALVVYSAPYKEYSWDEVRSEYADTDGCPFKQYVHHYIKRFEGEVALAWQNWTFTDDPLPRNAKFWEEQYATDFDNYAALSSLRTHWAYQESQYVINDDEDLRQVGNTTIIRTKDGCSGHWRLNGGAITLAELFHQFGKDFSVAEIMLWYHNAPKMLRKRPHSWGSKDVRAAARMRNKVYGHYAHRD